MERETGIEPATNSLEGCDSTTELLPPTRSLTAASRFGGQARCRARSPAAASRFGEQTRCRARSLTRRCFALRRAGSLSRSLTTTASRRNASPGLPSEAHVGRASFRAAPVSEGWWRGKDSNLRSR